MYWKEILQAYEDMGVEDIIPIAHTRVKPNIKVLLDEIQRQTKLCFIFNPLQTDQ